MWDSWNNKLWLRTKTTRGFSQTKTGKAGTGWTLTYPGQIHVVYAEIILRLVWIKFSFPFATQLDFDSMAKPSTLWSIHRVLSQCWSHRQTLLSEIRPARSETRYTWLTFQRKRSKPLPHGCQQQPPTVDIVKFTLQTYQITRTSNYMIIVMHWDPTW